MRTGKSFGDCGEDCALEACDVGFGGGCRGSVVGGGGPGERDVDVGAAGGESDVEGSCGFDEESGGLGRWVCVGGGGEMEAEDGEGSG